MKITCLFKQIFNQCYLISRAYDDQFRPTRNLLNTFDLIWFDLIWLRISLNLNRDLAGRGGGARGLEHPQSEARTCLTPLHWNYTFYRELMERRNFVLVSPSLAPPLAAHPHSERSGYAPELEWAVIAWFCKLLS